MSNTGQYPRFADGDVAIIAPTGHSWKLHSHILSQFCPTFRKLLQKERGHASKRQKIDGNFNSQWKFTMVVMDQRESLVDFRPVDLSVKQTMGLPVSLNANGGKPEYLTTYDNLFRCFYNLDPDLDHDGARASLTHRSVRLVDAAERIDALGPVRRAIESHLLRLGQVLWQRIVTMPHLFAELAIRLESPAIYKEAMVHVIGAWRLPRGMGNMDVSDPSSISDDMRTVREIAARRVAQLDEWKQEVELRLIHYVPPLLRKQVVDGKTPGRAEYASDIYLWQAFTLIRQHITMALINNQGCLAQDGGAAFYRQLHHGGSAYLRPKALEVFLEDFPMTNKGEQKFENAMSILKEQYRDLTAELMVNNGQPFAADAPALGYLTLAFITEQDFPWIEEGNTKPSALLFSDSVNRAPTAAMGKPATSGRSIPVGLTGGSPSLSTNNTKNFIEGQAAMPATPSRSSAAAANERGTLFESTPKNLFKTLTTVTNQIPITPKRSLTAATSEGGALSKIAPKHVATTSGDSITPSTISKHAADDQVFETSNSEVDLTIASHEYT